MTDYKNNDEIDFIRVLQVIWHEKLALFAFCFFSILFSILYLSTKKPIYESVIVKEIDNIAPFSDIEKTSFDFIKLFLSEEHFENWKKTINSSNISYKNFKRTKLISNFIFFRFENEREANLIIKDKKNQYKGGIHIKIKSNDKNLINDYYKYANFTNKSLTKIYKDQAKEDLSYLTKYTPNSVSSAKELGKSVILDAMYLNRYIKSKDNEPYVVYPPTEPGKIFPRKSVIITISLVAGLFIGLIYIYIKTNIINRFTNQSS